MIMLGVSDDLKTSGKATITRNIIVKKSQTIPTPKPTPVPIPTTPDDTAPVMSIFLSFNILYLLSSIIILTYF